MAEAQTDFDDLGLRHFTYFHTRKAFGDRVDTTSHLGSQPSPKKNPSGAKIGVFKPNLQNIPTYIRGRPMLFLLIFWPILSSGAFAVTRA